MTGSNQKKDEVVLLTGPQHKAVLALAAGHLKKEAAEQAGVHPQAISGWLKQPHFQAALDSLRGELVSRAGLELRAMTATAVFTLRELLENGAQPTRLRAAMFVLDRLLAAQRAQQINEPEPPPEVSTEKILEAMGYGR